MLLKAANWLKSFRGLSIVDPPRRSQINTSVVNYNAGADVLHKYQSQWSEMHKLAEENAVKAQELDSFIGSLHQKFEKQWSDVSHIASNLAAAPQLLTTVQQLMEQIGSLQGLFEDVEEALFQLEDMIEMQELQERQLDHRFQFALYKEKKLSELEAVRANLASEHADKVVQHELRQQKLLKERQDAFGEAFQHDVQHYKLSGSLPKVKNIGVIRGPSLEEVTLEPTDTEELDKFLNDDSTTLQASRDSY
ncbi:dysbindin-like isoform X2 [Zootermopsis nevadensis]|uniref:dysbindin-like isoform X2 n=1 Tax=Zootermopsis nevadensis TaxID=136037 RepID=UPI000B8ECE5F|nr:dysbindin-like isoform X2 [Zootermopsis nevadensis]